jgi:hypothetical protein
LEKHTPGLSPGLWACWYPSTGHSPPDIEFGGISFEALNRGDCFTLERANIICYSIPVFSWNAGLQQYTNLLEDHKELSASFLSM